MSESKRVQRTAAGHLARVALTAKQDETTATARARLVEGVGYESGELQVLDDEGRLVGRVPLPRLLAAQVRPLREVMEPAPPCAAVTDDQERVASIAAEHGLAAVPVADDQGRFLGLVPAPALIAILRHEHLEDLSRLSGMQHENDLALQAMTAAPLRRARLRLPWLLVGLAGSMLATGVMASFEEALQDDVKLAFFVPGLVYLADAIGTQSEAIAVRGISVHAVTPISRLIAGEVATGLILGGILAALTFPAAWIAFGDPSLAAAVSLAILAAGTVATGVGATFPWALHALGTDPAFGAGPVGTIVQDVLTLLLFFGTVYVVT